MTTEPQVIAVEAAIECCRIASGMDGKPEREECASIIQAAIEKAISKSDHWHSVSEPPTEKDFEPAKAVGTWCGNFSGGEMSWSEFHHFKNVTHWRRIIPPK